MSDEDDNDNPLLLAIQNGAVVPPKSNASHLSITISVAEFFVLFGNGRQVVAADFSGALPNLLIEWFQSIAISPTVAKNFATMLTQAVQTYEQTYGAIPQDPGTTMNWESSTPQVKAIRH